MVGLVDAELALDQVHIANKVRHKAVGRVLVNLFGRAHLQHTALAHDRDAVGHGHGLFLVVGDHDAGDTHFLNDVDQLKLGLLAQLFVQCAQWLVKQQQLGPFGQAARQCHTLLLPARELVGLALGKNAQLHQVQHFAHALLDFVARQAFALEAKGHVLPNVQVRKQRVGLEHHVHRPVVRRELGHVLTAQQNAAGGGQLKAGQHAQQRGLAAARTSQQRKNLSLGNRQGHIVHRHRLVKAFDQFLGHQVIGGVDLRHSYFLLFGLWGGSAAQQKTKRAVYT